MNHCFQYRLSAEPTRGALRAPSGHTSPTRGGGRSCPRDMLPVSHTYPLPGGECELVRCWLGKLRTGVFPFHALVHTPCLCWRSVRSASGRRASWSIAKARRGKLAANSAAGLRGRLFRSRSVRPVTPHGARRCTESGRGCRVTPPWPRGTAHQCRIAS